MMTHNRANPAAAPVLVVAMSSPEPTIDPAIINPGPRRLRTPTKVWGGFSMPEGMASLSSALFVFGVTG